MIDPKLCHLIDPAKVADLPVGCPVEVDTIIEKGELEVGIRTATPWTPGEYGFSGVFLRVGYIRVGPKGKRKAFPVARIYETRWRREIAVPLDGIRVRCETAIEHCKDVAKLAGFTMATP